MAEIAAKPTLHEIAAMPFPASVNAMREHYNPEWAKPIPEGAKLQTYSVDVSFSYSGYDSRRVDVEAFSAKEAEEKAGDLIDDEFDNIEIIAATAKPKGASQ